MGILLTNAAVAAATVAVVFSAGDTAFDEASRLRVVHPPRREAQLDTSRTISRLAFGSCNKHDKSQAYWLDIVRRRPDVFVWLGDIVYADSPVFLKWRIPAAAATLQRYYTAQLASAEYGTLLEAVPVVGVFDDHDAGTNVRSAGFSK